MTELSDPSPAALEQSANGDLLPIREVVRLTGVNPVTLRAWERRYGLIQPLRTEGGHRLYSLEDVTTIRSIMSWTERGVAVSKVGDLLARSRSLEADVQLRAPQAAGRAPVIEDAEHAGVVLQECSDWQHRVQQAAAAFDESRLEQLYGQLFSTYEMAMVFEEVLLPVWQVLSHQTGFGQRSQWLYLDAFLRARVLQRLQLARRPDRGCVLLVALPGQCRELELLVAGLLLGDAELMVRVLPLEQPLDELPLLCQSIQPQALVLFAPAPPTNSLMAQLGKLALAVDCPVALAGVGAELSADRLQGNAIARLGSQPQLMRRRLRQFIEGRLDT